MSRSSAASSLGRFVVGIADPPYLFLIPITIAPVTRELP